MRPSDLHLLAEERPAGETVVRRGGPPDSRAARTGRGLGRDAGRGKSRDRVDVRGDRVQGRPRGSPRDHPVDPGDPGERDGVRGARLPEDDVRGERRVAIPDDGGRSGASVGPGDPQGARRVGRRNEAAMAHGIGRRRRRVEGAALHLGERHAREGPPPVRRAYRAARPTEEGVLPLSRRLGPGARRKRAARSSPVCAARSHRVRSEPGPPAARANSST